MSLNSKRLQVQGSTFSVSEKTEMMPESIVKYANFATSLPSAMFQIYGDVEAVGFSLQNVYKMAYGDENTTFEPLNF